MFAWKIYRSFLTAFFAQFHLPFARISFPNGHLYNRLSYTLNGQYLISIR